MPKIAPQALKTCSPLEPDWMAKAAVMKLTHKERADSAAFDRQAALRIPYIARAEGRNESGKTNTKILVEDGQRLRPWSFLKDAKSSSATFGRHRINISPLAGIGLTFHYDRAATPTIERRAKREGLHQEAFTIFIITTITNARMPASTITMPNKTQRKLGGFFDGGGSLMTTCEYRKVSS